MRNMHERRDFLKRLGGLGAITALLTPMAALALEKRFTKTKAEWLGLISQPQYDVLFNEATERAFSSPLNKENRAGVYVCAACMQPLFLSTQKYDSGTGWPSFYDVMPNAIGTQRDFKLLLPRTEYHCNNCGGHQGHVFDDGPKPTGKRYCNNGLALAFFTAGSQLPPVRTS